MLLLRFLTLFVVPILAAASLPAAPLGLPDRPAADTPAFGNVWYQGTAEITSYRLEQARYGEVHEGHAVLIFVTEDFSRQRHVKLDGPPGPDEEAVKVMKLNFTRKFLTGIYPYSLMSSVFSPVHPSEGAEPLKITTSSQEWCGHTFAQLDRTAGGFHLRAFSYFGSEGDEDRPVAAELTEDGLWNRVRLDPASLPTGSFELVPGTQHARLRHVPFAAHPAEGTLTADPADPEMAVYRLHYPTLERTLTIRFQRDFPHEIETWEDSHPSGFGPGARRLTTRATRIERTMTAYWRQNGVGDRVLRRSELGLGR